MNDERDEDIENEDGDAYTRRQKKKGQSFESGAATAQSGTGCIEWMESQLTGCLNFIARKACSGKFRDMGTVTMDKLTAEASSKKCDCFALISTSARL